MNPAVDTTVTDVTASISTNGHQMNANKEMSSLGMLALAYENSDSDTDETEPKSHIQPSEQNTNVVQLETMKDYRTEASIESSSETSDDDSDETSSINSIHTKSLTDSEDTTESDGNLDKDDTTNCKNGNKKTDKLKTSQAKKVKGELDDLPPIEDLKINVPEVLCEPLGEIGWTVEQMVIVRPTAGKPTLNLDTVLFLERGRKVLGQVFDVFGQVSEPHYCVRFNNTKHIQENNIKVGMTVYYCPSTPYTSLVFLHELMKLKGSEELGDDEPPEFSDDEEERAYYEMQKQKKNGAKSDMQNTETSHNRKRPRAQPTYWQSDHPWNNWKQPHDDQGNRFTEHNVHAWNTDQQNAYHSQNARPPPVPFLRTNMRPPFSFQRPSASVPRQIISRPDFQCERDSYSDHSESVQSNHQNVYNYNQHSCSQQSHLTYKDGMIPPLGPRHIFGAPPRFHPGHAYFAQCRPNTFSSPPIRLPRMGFPWYPRPPPSHMNVSWLPPPPPPPSPPPPPPPPCT